MKLPSPVQTALARQYVETTAFGRWCAARRVPCFPTLPGYLAGFVADSPPSDGVIAAVIEISRLHVGNGYADPNTEVVAASFLPVVAPRSWPKEMKIRFRELPFDVQRYVADRETERDREVRRCQNELAAAKQQLNEIQKEKTNVVTEEKPDAEGSARSVA